MTTFHEFEQAGWQRAASGYSGAFGSLTSQAIEPLLDAAAVSRGMRMLDVATGPGYAAAAAHARGAAVIGIDFSAEMLKRARTANPDVEFREGDAQALPFADASFDAVVMNFGLLHLAHPDRAIAEAWRLLERGSRYAFTIWAPPDQTIGFGIVLRAIERYGNTNVALPEGPPFFPFSTEDECRRILAQFENVELRQLPLVWRFGSPDLVLDAFLGGSVRTGALLRAQTHEALDRIRMAVAEQVAAGGRTARGIELPMPALLVSARKPKQA